MSRVPMVRHLVPCERVERLPNGSVTLHGVFHTVPARPDTAYPRSVAAFAAYVLMTDGTGMHEFQVFVVYLDDEVEELCHASPKRMLNLGTHPLAVHHWDEIVVDVTFPRAGLYELRLLCDNDVVAVASFTLRRARS